MGIFSINKDAFERAAKEVAKDSFGLIYAEQDADEIQTAYINDEETGGLIGDAEITHRQVRKNLQELASDGNSNFEQVRESVYFFDLIGMGHEDDLDTLTPEVVSLFEDYPIVNKKTLLDRFGAAKDDDEFFISHLRDRDRNYVDEFKVGAQSYYTVGDYLEEEYDAPSISEELQSDSTHGTVNHQQLSRKIPVDTKEDIIRHLEGEEYILDLDGEYLVLQPEEIDEFTANVAGQISDEIAAEFEQANYIMPTEETKSLITDAVSDAGISNYPDALARAKNINYREKLLDGIVESVEREVELLEDGRFYKQEEFDEFVEERAVRAVENAQAQGPTGDTEWTELAVEELQTETISSNPSVVGHYTDAVKAQIEQEIESRLN